MSNKNYEKLFKEEYELSNSNRSINWNLSYSIIDSNDTVLVQGRYCVDVYKYHFYIIEKSGKKYLRIVNVRNVEDKIEDICYDYFDGYISWNNTQNVGVFLPKYKDLVLSKTTEVLLDDNIDKILDNMKSIDFDKFYMEDFTYKSSVIKYDCYDFNGKHVFVADGYCLKKYKPYVDLIDYIFKVSKINHSSSFKIKLVDNFNEAYKDAILEKEEENDWIL